MTALKFSCTKCGGTNVRLAITTPETAQLPHVAHVAFGGGTRGAKTLRAVGAERQNIA